MKCSAAKLDKLESVIKREGRLHIFDATAFLCVTPKYFQYDILPYFIHRYEDIELQDSFLIAKTPQTQKATPGITPPARAVHAARIEAPASAGGP